MIQGELSLFGSLLQASTIQHSVFAPKNYPTATIKALEHSGNNKTLPETIAKSVNPSQTVIMVKDLHSGIQGLGRVCGILQPAFETVNEFSFDLRLREFHPVSRICKVLGPNSPNSPFRLDPSWKYISFAVPNPTIMGRSIRRLKQPGRVSDNADPRSEKLWQEYVWKTPG